jgi:hypothetical protein
MGMKTARDPQVHDMDSDLIAIVGSADETRTYDPPLQDHAQARKTAELLGRALAERGFRMVVYHPSPNYIEGDAVRGFLQAQALKPGSIVVEYPLGQKGATAFPEYDAHRDAFKPKQDTSENWEVSFYRSLSRAGGVALIGGGQSTLVAGMVALMQEIPLVAFPAFGGKAQKIWQKLGEGGGLATKEDAGALASPEPEAAVEAAVRSLAAQQKERHHRRNVRPERKAQLGAAALLVAWPCLLALGAIVRPPQANGAAQVPGLFWFLLLVGPLFAGASGATTRAFGPDGGDVTARNLVRGTAAGLVCALAYLAGMAANGTVTFVTLLIEFLTAFVGGFTADQVLSQLSDLRALRDHALDQGAKTHGSGSAGVEPPPPKPQRPRSNRKPA